MTVRKIVRTTDAIGLIENVYDEAINIEKRLKEQEIKLAREKVIKETNKKVGVYVN